MSSTAMAADWVNIQDVAASTTQVTSIMPIMAVMEAPISAPVATSTVMLKMADGSFYHPGTGKKAATEMDLRVMLGLEPGEVVVAPPAVVEPAVPAILTAVYRGQQGLRDRLHAAGQDKIINIKPVGQESARSVTLAIWNRTTDEIVYVDAVKKGNELDLDDTSPVDVKVRLANYINSDYATNDPNHVVVAVRYPIYHEVFKGKKVVSYNVEEAVYSPASGALLTDEVIKAGEDLLDTHIAAAITDLHKEKTIAPELIKSIVIIEHSDISSIKRDPSVPASKVFATIALNPTNPYAYSRSSAGALGLFQFIPSTYNRLAKRPALGLNPNFEAGMSDPKNASKAAVAYMDAVLRDLPSDAQLVPTSTRSFEYFAAAYNGGSAKIKRASLVWDEQINGEVKPKEVLKRARLQPETIDYVRKLRALLPVIMGTDATLTERSLTT